METPRDHKSTREPHGLTDRAAFCFPIGEHARLGRGRKRLRFRELRNNVSARRRNPRPRRDVLPRMNGAKRDVECGAESLSLATIDAGLVLNMEEN